MPHPSSPIAEPKGDGANLTGRAGPAPAVAPVVPRSLAQHLARHAATRGAEPALRHKARGRWRTWTWQQLAHEVELFSLGLVRLGFGAGDVLAVLGDTEPRQIVAVLATHLLGGAVIPVDPEWTAPNLGTVLINARVRFAYSSDHTGVERLFAATPPVSLTAIIYGQARGLRGYSDARLHAFDALVAHVPGTSVATVWEAPTEHAGDQTTAAVAAFGFWSIDETGRARGVWIDQGELLAAAQQTADDTAVTGGDESMASSSLSSAFSSRLNALNLAAWQVVGFRLNCAESGGSAELDRRQISPTYLFAPSTWYRALWRDVDTRLPATGTWRRRLIDVTLTLLARVHEHDPASRDHRIGWLQRSLLRLGQFLVSRPLGTGLGLGRVRVAVAVGQPLDSESRTFLSALGIRIRSLSTIRPNDIFTSATT